MRDSKRSPTTNISKRHQWISEAAYFNAEARKFEPGKELDDWLEAEVEHTKFLIKSFLIQCKEDGGLSVAELQVFAGSIGIDHPEYLNTEAKLIREIQKSSLHHRPCFQSENRVTCHEQECQWQEECQKLIATWLR